jgi:hypothetical protein
LPGAENSDFWRIHAHFVAWHGRCNGAANESPRWPDFC